MRYFLDAVKNMTEKGIEVYTNNFQPYGDFYRPQRMYDLNGAIKSKIQPFRLSEVNSSYLHLA